MSNIELRPIPIVTSGMSYGGTPEENVLNYMKSQAELQTIMNNKYGGTKYLKNNKSYKKYRNKNITKNKNKLYNKIKKNKSYNKIKKRTYKFKGGSATIEVPQFPQNNLNNSPQNVNTNSLLLNKIYIDALNNSRYNCYATNTCPKNMSGGKYKIRRNKTKKYKLKKNRKLNGGCNCGINNLFLRGGGTKSNKRKKGCNCLNSKFKKLFNF